MAATCKTIRVLIFSIFCDMHVARDRLVMSIIRNRTGTIVKGAV